MIAQNGNVLTVTGPMLIANACALLEAGRDFLRAGAPVDAQADAPVDHFVLDLAQAEETDSSALAVIFGLLRTARERGVIVRVAHPPVSMISQAALYGVTDFLSPA